MFRDRHHAGQALAEHLQCYFARDDAVVVALPFGGVAVGSELARALRLPFDVFVARRLPVPGQPELTMGAVAYGHVCVIDDDVVERHGIDADAIAGAEAEAWSELQRYEHAYHHDIPGLRLAGKMVLLADDGFADDAMLRAVVRALRLRGARRIVVAVPVGAVDGRCRLVDDADEVVHARTPPAFGGSSCWYADFSRPTDREVLDLLRLVREQSPPDS